MAPAPKVRFHQDFPFLFLAELRKFYRWKERILWDLIGPLTLFLGFVLVWKAVLAGGFAGIGNLNADTYVIFLLSGTLLWQVIGINLGPVSHTFVREKYARSSVYFLLSPASRLAFIFAKASLALVQILITNGIVILIAILLFDFSFNGSLLLAGLIYMLTFLAFSGIGIGFAALGAWREGIADGVWLCSEVLMILSGVWYPIEIFPEPIRSFCAALPSTQAIQAIRTIGIEGAGIAQLAPQLVYLGGLAMISPIIGYYIFKWVEGKAMLIGI
jgi:ABC-2 type transport system permease protein